MRSYSGLGMGMGIAAAMSMSAMHSSSLPERPGSGLDTWSKNRSKPIKGKKPRAYKGSKKAKAATRKASR